MPFLKLATNIKLSEEQTPLLLGELSRLVARETGKPESYVMIEIEGGRSMLFGGSDTPLAYLECKSIGLSPVQAKALSASLPQLLEEKLELARDRIYIEFSNAPAGFWGWNGSTFG
jgi:phenylpyruvate tautomerase